ncbi:hypothetical protein [Corynebacterium ulceribovis]|uniref:hypothetical protein n=1 Tax=Corynebacterium ulceribovis TaxID=487732 RepID=UPI0003687D08|nr:hypothetical protein [Corynebacterium ulceribovis]
MDYKGFSLGKHQFFVQLLKKKTAGGGDLTGLAEVRVVQVTQSEGTEKIEINIGANTFLGETLVVALNVHGPQGDIVVEQFEEDNEELII